MSTSTYEADTVRILHKIPDEVTGGPKDMTGGSVIAIIARPEGETFNGNAIIEDALNGQISMEFTPDSFEAKTYAYQIRLTDSVGDVQTVVESSISAKRSLRLFAPAVVLTRSAWADALKALPGFYATTTAGLDATADTDYFGVATQDGTRVELWQNDAGTAAPVSMEVQIIG